MDDRTSNQDPTVDQSIVDRAERKLRAHVERAEQQLRELESDLGGMHGDGETIQEDRDGMRRLIESARADLARTQRAIGRIEAGTYGRCTSCGEPIASARLSAIPESERCSNCA